MRLDLLLGLIVFLIVYILLFLSRKFDIPFLSKKNKMESGDITEGEEKTEVSGSNFLFAFLCGFIVFIIFTDRMPAAWQKIPVIAVAVVLGWANRFLNIRSNS